MPDHPTSLPQTGAAARRWAMALLLGCGLLQAQAPLADSEEQRRRAQEEAEERQRLRQAPQVHLQEPEAAAEADRALPAESPSFRIDRILLEVPASLPAELRALGGRRFRFARRYLARYRGRQIGPEGIRLILRRLSRRILARGFTTTRVDLPEQDLGVGTLKLSLIPGVIRAIRFADPSGGSWRSAFPARPGDLLNLRDLEQGLEQMKRVPSQDVAIAIIPGARPGESEVVLTLRRGRPWRASVNADDSGLPATGQWQGSLGIAWDRPLGGADLFSASLNHDATAWLKGGGTRGGSLACTVPMGYWTFGAGWSQSRYDQRIAGVRRDFTSSGVSRNLDLRAGWLFHRDQTRKDTLQLRIGHRAGRSFLDGTELDVQRRSNSFVELSLIHSQSLGRAQLDLTGSHRRGVSWFGAQPDLAPGGPTFFYRIQTLDATLGVPLAIGRQRLQYTAALHAQHSSRPLYATEYVSIGNRWTVRGFDGAVTLAAENGGFLRHDLEWLTGRGASLYLGLDAGRVHGEYDRALPGRALAGAVLGLKGVIGRTLSFNVFLGGPLHQPRHFPNRWPVVGLSASVQI